MWVRDWETAPRALADEDRRHEMGRLGQQRVVEKFEWRALCGEIAQRCEEYMVSTH